MQIYIYKRTPGPTIITKDLPSLLILIIADQMLIDSLSCSNKSNWCSCRFIGKLCILLLVFLIICLKHVYICLNWIGLNLSRSKQLWTHVLFLNDLTEFSCRPDFWTCLFIDTLSYIFLEKMPVACRTR